MGYPSYLKPTWQDSTPRHVAISNREFVDAAALEGGQNISFGSREEAKTTQATVKDFKNNEK